MSAEYRPGDKVPSIYDRIHAAILPNGELPSSFSVQSPDPEGIAWADGAWDGVCIYHNRLETPDLAPMILVLRRGSSHVFAHAKMALPEVFPDADHSMLAYVDAAQNWILDHTEELDAQNLYLFARHLLFYAREKEEVKLALSLLEIIWNEKDEEVRQAVRELAASDEFTLFATFAVRHWENSNEEVFRMAQKVHGWGRIHAVAQLEPTTEEIRRWLLREGVENDVMPEYSALTVAEKIDLLNVVRSADRNSEDFAAAGKILAALIESDGGPVLGIEAYGQEEALVRAYIDKARLAMPNEEIYRVLRAIQLHYAEEEDEEFQAMAKEADAVLSSDSCLNYMRHKAEQGENLRLASQLGVDCAGEIKAAFRKDWRKNCAMLKYLENLEDVIEMANFFLANVRDEDFITPQNHLVGGAGNFAYETLLEGLSGYSMAEALLLERGLRTSVARSRLMTLKRLRQWKENGKITNALRRAIDEWKKRASDIKLRFEYQDL
ncbi:MAG: hypothetical protein J6N99_10405 [Schwartzia sp.]|nr:hypothetical protein [Schwartzia sp. (in: firmicutes)]